MTLLMARLHLAVWRCRSIDDEFCLLWFGKCIVRSLTASGQQQTACASIRYCILHPNELYPFSCRFMIVLFSRLASSVVGGLFVRCRFNRPHRMPRSDATCRPLLAVTCIVVHDVVKLDRPPKQTTHHVNACCIQVYIVYAARYRSTADRLPSSALMDHGLLAFSASCLVINLNYDDISARAAFDRCYV